MGHAAQKVRPTIGQIEFVCWIIDTEALLSAARKRGWRDDMDHGPLDYAEPYDHERGRSFATKNQAIAYAQAHSGEDFFGSPTVRRRQYRRDQITPIVVEWKDEYEWLVNEDGIDSEQVIEADDDC